MGKLENKNRKNEISKSLGKNLLKMRKEKGYTREELAEKSNLSANYIYGLEKGIYLPGCMVLIDLSNALDVTTSQLLDKYLDDNKSDITSKIVKQINRLSNRDLELIINILDYLDENS